MIITTAEYFTHPSYSPDLEPRQDLNRLREFFLRYSGFQTNIWIKGDFSRYIHDEIDAGESSLLQGVIHSIIEDTVILDPWFMRKDFGTLGKLALQANGADGLVVLTEMNYLDQMSALSHYGLVIPLNQITWAGLKKGL